MGAYSHHDDLSIVVPAIKKLKKTYKNIEFYYIGGSKEKINLMTKIIPPISEYPDFVNWLLDISIDFDFAICPLLNTEFTQYKSYIKYLDYSACQLPAIYTDNDIYKRVIKHKVNGILTKNTDSDWYNALLYMIENQKKRTDMAKNAFFDVYNNHSYPDTIVKSEISSLKKTPINLKKIRFNKFQINGNNNKVIIDEKCNIINPTIIIVGNNNQIEIEPAYIHSNLHIEIIGDNKKIKIKRSKKVIKNLKIKSMRGNNQTIFIDNDLNISGCKSKKSLTCPATVSEANAENIPSLAAGSSTQSHANN
jgi:hypothetical protein